MKTFSFCVCVRARACERHAAGEILLNWTAAGSGRDPGPLLYFSLSFSFFVSRRRPPVLVLSRVAVIDDGGGGRTDAPLSAGVLRGTHSNVTKKKLGEGSCVSFRKHRM